MKCPTLLARGIVVAITKPIGWATNTIGIGPGAARYVAGRREVNHRSTTNYLRRVLDGKLATAESEELSPEDRARERLVLACAVSKALIAAYSSDSPGFQFCSWREIP